MNEEDKKIIAEALTRDINNHNNIVDDGDQPNEVMEYVKDVLLLIGVQSFILFPFCNAAFHGYGHGG